MKLERETHLRQRFVTHRSLCIVLLILGSEVIAVSGTCEPAPADEISVLAVGDITVGSRMTPLIEEHGAGIFFQGTTALVQAADIATASLNTSISDRGEPRYGIQHPFRSAPGLGRALANAGFDVVSLATPHVMDFGLAALADTITELERYNVKLVGAGESVAAAKRPAWVPVRVEGTQDRQVAVFAYYRMSEFSPHSGDPVARAVYSEMPADIRAVRAKAALIVVWLHWGERGHAVDEAIGRQRIFARALIDAGADIVLCQQLQTFGGIELYRRKLIVYSLADFIYDLYAKQHSHIVIPKATFNTEGLKSIELIPILTDPPKTPSRTSKSPAIPAAVENVEQFPTLLTGTAAVETLQAYQQRCVELGTEVAIEGERGWIR